MKPFSISFEISDPERFDKAVLAYDRIRECKETDEWPECEEDWKSYFDARSLKHFWWPTEEEKNDWAERWFSTSVETRFTDPSLQTPWDFMSMLDAFQNGEYALLPIERIGPHSGILHYDPHAFPYGGNGCMRALLDAKKIGVKPLFL